MTDIQRCHKVVGILFGQMALELCLIVFTNCLYKMSTQQKFRHLQDLRTQVEKQQQHQRIQLILRNNLRNFNIELTPKQKITYTASPLIRVSLPHGWYCHITDNMLTPARFTVVTIHGCPGDHREWAGLEYQMGGVCRWINFVYPGYDGEDERRGTFDGSLEHMSQLLIQMTRSRGIEKFVFCGHSMGSMFMSYFVTHYRESLEGSISITGITDTWYIGLKTFYSLIVVENGLNVMTKDRNRILDDDKFRKKLTRAVNTRGSQICFGPAPFPELTESEVCGYVRLLNSAETGLSELFEKNSTMAPDMLKVYIFGKIDPLEETTNIEEMMYKRCFDPKRNEEYLKQIRPVRDSIEKRCLEEQAVKLDLDWPQTNFIYNFEQTGHNAHKRRPKEIAKVLRTYLIVLDQVAKGKEKNQQSGPKAKL